MDIHFDQAGKLIRPAPTRWWDIMTATPRQPDASSRQRRRMQVAVGVLRDEGATVAELEDRLGYGSEAAFSPAFKRVTGVAPGAMRRGRSEPVTV